MYRSWAEEDAEFELFMARFETLPRDTNSTIDAFKALPTEALPVDTNELAIPVDTDDPMETNAPDTLVDAPSTPEAQKYDGTNGSFDHKLAIFHDICQRIDLPQETLARAFPTMLKGLAQDHFYNNPGKSTYEVNSLCKVNSLYEYTAIGRGGVG